jgi:catalase
MPLPTDEHTLALSRDLIQTLDDLNGGVHAGFRPAHAKGVMLSGTFTPSRDARSLTRAPHIERPSTPVIVRFSDSTGLPKVADNDAEHASPRGMAIRFQLAEHVHTDVIGHSHDGFPVRTPEEFLEMLRAVYSSGQSKQKPLPIESFLITHPAALAFVKASKPIPSSFARESFFAVSAYKFTNQAGESRFGRYRIRPLAGNEPLDPAAAAAKSSNFLFEEIAARIAKEPVKFEINVQVAEAGDVVDDATVRWPENRPKIAFGTIALNALVPNGESAERTIIFDPIPRVDGIESSGDPLLEVRAAVYLMSGRRRREATGTAKRGTA